MQGEEKVHDDDDKTSGDELLTPPHHMVQRLYGSLDTQESKDGARSEKVQMEWQFACFQAQRTSHPLQRSGC